MVFCNDTDALGQNKELFSHNPYFNRWFSAIKKDVNTFEYTDKSQSLF